MTGPKISSTNSIVSSPARRQHRSRRDHPQRTRRHRARIRFAPPCWPSRPGRTASPPICARTAAISATKTWPPPARNHRPLNFEMAATRRNDGALRLGVRPHAVCLVPEKREERTTEGGLDVVKGHNHLAPYVAELECRGHPGLACSSRPMPRPHRGIARTWAHRWSNCTPAPGARPRSMATTPRPRASSSVLSRAAERASSLGLEVHAGHGLDFETARADCCPAGIAELNIGHFLIGEAVFVGLEEAIQRMRAAMDAGRARGLAAISAPAS